MYDDFYYDSDDGMSIERISEEEANEFREIEGIEADEEHAGQDVFDPNAEEMPADVPGELRSTPESPLYDPETGERIPNGYTMKDWEKRKEAVAKKQAEIKARIEKERKAFEQEEQRQMQLSEEEAYLKRQEAAEGYADVQISDSVAGHGEDNIISDEIDIAEDQSLNEKITESNPFEDARTVNREENPVPEKWQDDFSYSYDKENGTITLEHYNGESDIVTIPSVAYDDDGNAFNVVLSNEEQIFSPEDVSYVGVSEEIPEDNFTDFFQNATGLDYQEVLEASATKTEPIEESPAQDIDIPELTANISDNGEYSEDISAVDISSSEQSINADVKSIPETESVSDSSMDAGIYESLPGAPTNDVFNSNIPDTEEAASSQPQRNSLHEALGNEPLDAEPMQGAITSENHVQNAEKTDSFSYNTLSEEKTVADTAAPVNYQETASDNRQENVFTEQGRNNIVSEEIPAQNKAPSKLDILNQIDTSKSYQMADAYNDGKADTSINMNAERKAQLNDTVVSQADSVVMTGATALEGYTQGNYGNTYADTMSSMVDTQKDFSEMTGSDAFKSGNVTNHSLEETVYKVSSSKEAAQNETNNYKEEKGKDSDARSYENKTEEKIVKDVVDGARFEKEKAPDGMTPTEKEDVTDIQSRMSEKTAKIKIKDYQTVVDGVEGVGNIVTSVVKNADESEENDVKKGQQMIANVKNEFDLLFGTSGVFAASSLDAAMGIRQADLMDKAMQNDVDVELMASYFNKKEQVTAYKEAMKASGMGDKDAQTAAIKAYKEAQNDLIEELKAKGFTDKEAKDFLKKGLGGQSAAENLSASIKAQKELLKFADSHAGVFTDEELAFLKSNGFFNTAKNSHQISSITSNYYRNCGNEYLKALNPSESYLRSIHSRINSKKLGPDLAGKGVLGKADAILDPHSYNLKPNLSKEDLKLANNKKLDKALKKDPDVFTTGQKDVIAFQRKVEKHGKDNERKKAFDKNKFSVKNFGKLAIHYFQKLDSDASRGLGTVLSIKRGSEALYSTVKFLGKSGRVTAKVATAPLRFISRKTGLTALVDSKLQLVKAAITAKKMAVKNAAVNSSVGQGLKAVKTGLSTVKTTIATSKPVVGVSSKINAAKTLKSDVKKKVSKKARNARNKAMNNTVFRVIISPFKGAGLVAKFFNKIKAIFAAIGHWVMIAVGVIVITWLILLFIVGFLMNLGKTVEESGTHAVLADIEMIEEWVDKYLALDDAKYEEAVSHSNDDPIDPYVWGGVRLYHYGVYEPTYTAYFNRNSTKCYYHEKGMTERSGATNGFHIIYIDKDGNTIGSNTTNVKDVISITSVMIDNNWFDYTSEAEDLQDKIYIALNPDAAYVESEIYACSQGCDTFPQKYTDGDSSNGLNWYSSSAYRAYECDDAELYAEYNRLKAAGAKFFNDDTFEYMSKKYYERLVPQTANGCNVHASFSFKRVKIQDSYYANHITLPSGLVIPDYSSYVPSVWEYQLQDVSYDYKCGGQTYVYTYDSDGYYYRSTRTSPYAYGSMFYSDDEHVNAVHGAGFYGYYSRDYSATIPHAAIKVCYGHKDLNVYITVLTKEDLIEANGGQIEYKVPVHFSHETGEVTEWTTKRTMNIYTYTRTNSNLQYLTKTFFDNGGFQSEEEVQIINQIYDEDWYDLYGVNVYTGAAIPDTLTREATTNKLNYTLLYDVSTVRSTIVRTAYSQVGKIPYYWGGKATSTNIAANKFGTTVKADYKGRTKKGLDCSGFVQLMFCIASGMDLNSVGANTSSFVPSLGLERISYSDLQPGDIGMENLPGASSNHIGIYAGGGMWIHCQGSPANTVVYNNTNCFRYYYSLGR